MLVTRPTLPLTGAISRADFQGLNDITVALEQSDLDDIVDEVQDQIPTGVAGINYLANPGMDTWTTGTSALSLAVLTRTPRADSWFARLNSTSSLLPTYQRTSNSQQSAWLYAALLTGNTGAESVDFGQEIPARVAAVLNGNITLTFSIENGTGSALTPQVRLDTCDTFEDYGTVTNRYAQNTGSSAAAGEFKTWNVTIDTTDYASQMRNGALLYVRFASGTLDSGSKTIKVFPSKLELGASATTNIVERDAPIGSGDTVNDRQFLINGDFHKDRWGSTSVTCLEDRQNYAAEGWWAMPDAGSTMTYERELASPDAATAYCAKLTGSAATTSTVDFGQNIPSAISRNMRRPCVVSFYLYNGTGASITPQVLFNTPASADTFTSVTNRDTQSPNACADSAWTLVSYAFDGSTYTNIANGLQFVIRIPAALTTGSDYVRIAQAKIELGAEATDYDPAPILRPPYPALPAAAGLIVKSTSSALVTVTADELPLRGTDGGLYVARSVSVTGINMAASGAGGLDTGAEASSTWYAIWIIADEAGNVAGLFSTSTTAPTMPNGYRYRTLVGYVRNDGSSNFIAFYQHDKLVYITPTAIVTANRPVSANTYELITAANSAITNNPNTLVPPAARAVRIHAGLSATTGTGIMAFAGDSAGLGEAIHVIEVSSNLGFGSLYKAGTLTVPLITAQNFYWKVEDVGSSNKRVECVGYSL